MMTIKNNFNDVCWDTCDSDHSSDVMNSQPMSNPLLDMLDNECDQLIREFVKDI